MWTPFEIRRNAWWACLSGACGFCTGTRMWEWKDDWRKWLDADSVKQIPMLRKGLESIAWWKLVPDAQHAFLTAGFGRHGAADYATAAIAADGSCAAVYLPSARTFTLNLWQLKSPHTCRWFDPTSGDFQPAKGKPGQKSGTQTFKPPAKSTAGASDWVLIIGSPVVPGQISPP